MKGIVGSDIKPAFSVRNVPVVLSTDENYLPYVKVAINSAVANATGSNLDFLILHSGICDEAIQSFIAKYAGLENVSVRFVDISGGLDGSKLADFKQTDRLPVSSCYRLLIPDILTVYDKVIYLDVDVVVCRDLGELYAANLGNNYFAAAKDLVHSTKPEYVSWAAKWGFTKWDAYVNSGVLVMNLELFRSEPVLDRLLAVVLEASKWLCDQDALNFVCKGRIAPLDPRWNAQLGDYCLKKLLAQTGCEMWIAHFTGSQKPWKCPARQFSHRWWRHVDKSDVSRLWSEAWGGVHVPPSAGTPKVSFVIPVYNAERYLSEALASILMQEETPEIEVICIDDGSTDDSAAILDFWKDRDYRLTVIRQANQGPGVARNVGMDVAKGEYISFLDADDRLSSEAKLDRLLKRAIDDNLDLLVCGGNLMTEDGTVLRKGCLNETFIPVERIFGPEALGDNLYLLTPQFPANKLYRRSFLLKEKISFPSLRRSEDFAFVQLSYALAKRISVETCPLVDRRVGLATSCESTKDETPLIFLDGERAFLDAMKQHRILEKFRRAVDISSVLRLEYNLGAVRRFNSFILIAKTAKTVYLPLKLRLADATPPCLAKAVELLDKIVANVDDVERLAETFADLQSKGKVSKLDFDAALSKLNAELGAARKRLKERWEQLDEAQKSRSRAWQQYDKVNVELSNARKRLQERWKQLDEAQKSRSRAWQQYDKAIAELKESNRLLNERWKQRENLQCEIKTYEKKYAQLLDEYDKCKNRLLQATVENSTMRNWLDRLHNIVSEQEKAND
ncbi:MAG: glycosyltransferase [Kiritimatiellae bacterium]|nr:glycosyltransferase [Kiritimatiellia bacterium]